MSLSKRNVRIVGMYEDLQTALDGYRKSVLENNGNEKGKERMYGKKTIEKKIK